MNMRNKGKLLIPGFAFLVSIVVTFGVFVLVQRDVAAQRSLQFDNEAQEITSLIQSQMNLYTNVIYGAQGLFAASQSVEPNEWSAYVSTIDLPQNYPGVSGMLYIERVPEQDAASFPYPMYPQKSSGDYYPITYIASTSTSMASSTAFGFDASSDPARWEAMQKSLQENAPAGSAVTTSIVSHVPVFNIYAPIYRNGAPVATANERQQALEGYVAATFRVSNLLSNFTSSPVFNKNIAVAVYDSPTYAQANSSNLLFATASSTQSIEGLSAVENATVAERTWTVVLTALPSYTLQSTERFAPPLILLVGILLSFLLAWALYLATESRERAVALAKRMTAELEQSKQKIENYSHTLEADITRRSEVEAKLKAQADELERLNNLMVGRELKMVELKEEIKRLNGKTQ